MRADTKSIFIQASPSKVAEFLASPQNLPRWAVGFAKSIRNEDGNWFVTTGAGDLGIRTRPISARESSTISCRRRPAPR